MTGFIRTEPTSDMFHRYTKSHRDKANLLHNSNCSEHVKPYWENTIKNGKPVRQFCDCTLMLRICRENLWQYSKCRDYVENIIEIRNCQE